MITPLKKTALHDLLNKPILFDANIFMVGISDRMSDKNCSFENMKKLYIKPLFESFTDIYIHEEVYKELDDDARTFVDTYKGKNVIMQNDNSNSKGLKSIYKKYCADVIKRHGLPTTLGEYIRASQDYL